VEKWEDGALFGSVDPDQEDILSVGHRDWTTKSYISGLVVNS